MDATGDGSLGAKAGAVFRKGRESAKQHGESLAPETEDGCTMGNSLMFKARDAGHPVAYTPPEWANTYTEEQLKFRDHSSTSSGYWWIELGGGQLDTISDAEVLRDELLKAVYGIWDHVKNGGSHGAENMDLEWVGYLPGKRESRRLIGDYILTENDISSSRRFEDAVAYGGWPMDVHAVEGFLNQEDSPTVWNRVNDVYTIPYRSLYSVNIGNLFLGGRAISCTHIAFSSTRVMGTCAVVGQAVGTAAALASLHGTDPRGVLNHIGQLQQELLKDDCYIPGIGNEDPQDMARAAVITASVWDEGCEPGLVVNGYGRTVGDQSNCWRADWKEDRIPELILSFGKDIEPRQLRLVFDSNLSREITPSMDEKVLARQELNPPSELVRDFSVEFLRNGRIRDRLLTNTGGQRLKVIPLPEGTVCDEVRVKVLSTYGSQKACIYEVRLYR